MSTSTASLPLDDRSNAIKLSYPFVAALSTVFVVLRIWYNFKVNKRRSVSASDCFLSLAQICALVGATFGYLSAWVGAGKHAWDPSVTEDDLTKYLVYLWFGQFFNLTAMAALKLSISAFMLKLNFSKAFRGLIWLTVVALIGLNVVFPYVILFGECRPIAKRWIPKLPGYCWSPKPRTISGYLGAASNIVSDLFYTCAPLVYTRNVKLPRRAKLGLRVVFLLGSITTIISAIKLYEIKALNESVDVAYQSVNLSVLSVTEVFVGTLTASLPPLRLLFENLLNRARPNTTTSIHDQSKKDSYVLSNWQKPRKSADNSSEDAILDPPPTAIIVRTTHVIIRTEAMSDRV
ncbi:hypothetical protein E8E12_002200 [Didymella heteroderae]|uniref:Rhodopsin domain-containing protein n=1 Tax=Didymella heteroderae TaxID=1769908 RepID=A0A9P5BVB6_9PLEO|nr:hypothetical protein E8E12_002200 [Didymella heteroderae]